MKCTCHYVYVMSENVVVEFFFTLPKITPTPYATSQKLVKGSCRIYFDIENYKEVNNFTYPLPPLKHKYIQLYTQYVIKIQ